MTLQIEYRKLESLIPYARNARTHSEAQVAQVAASIKEFGWTNPVLIDETGSIIAGHGRVMAARKLGIDDVPCITLTGLTDAQKRAYVIADNKLALNAGWDDELLALELADIKADGFDIDMIGFKESEIDLLFGVADPVPLDEVEQIKEECVLAIVCSDWKEREEAIARLGGKKIDWAELAVRLKQ